MIAALGIGSLYSARQDYEDELARTYELESRPRALLAAGVVEEAALRERGPDAAAARRRAAAGASTPRPRGRWRWPGRTAESRRLVRARVGGAAARAPRWPSARASPARERRLAERDLRRARGRARARRAASASAAARRATAPRERSRTRADRRGGGRRRWPCWARCAGRGADRLDPPAARRAWWAPRGSWRPATSTSGSSPAGPQELRDLGGAFNAMAERLGAAQRRIEEERLKLAVTIESLGDALVVADADGRGDRGQPARAREVVPELAPGRARRRRRRARCRRSTRRSPARSMREQGERTLSITAARLGERRGARGSSGRSATSPSARGSSRSSPTSWPPPRTSCAARSPRSRASSSCWRAPTTLGEREREFVDVILQSTDRLVDLVNDLLDVARLEAGKMEVHPRLFDLAEVVREVATLMAPAPGRARSSSSTLDLPPGLPRALADPGRVRQIVTNLLSNAHLLHGRGRPARDRRSAPTDGELELAVSDNGRGHDRRGARARLRPLRAPRGRHRAAPGSGSRSSSRSSTSSAARSTSRASRAAGTTFTVRLPAEARGRPPRPSRGRRSAASACSWWTTSPTSRG